MSPTAAFPLSDRHKSERSRHGSPYPGQLQSAGRNISPPPRRYHGLNMPPSVPRPLPVQDRRGSLRNKSTVSASDDVKSSPTAVSPPEPAAVRSSAAPAAALMPRRSMRTLASKLSPPGRGALRGPRPGRRGTRQGRHLGLCTGAMTQATTPPLVVALDAAGLHGDPAKPLPPTPAVVACCWLGSGGMRRLAYIKTCQTAAWAPRLSQSGDRPVVMGGLGILQDVRLPLSGAAAHGDI